MCDPANGENTIHSPVDLNDVIFVAKRKHGRNGAAFFMYIVPIFVQYTFFYWQAARSIFM